MNGRRTYVRVAATFALSGASLFVAAPASAEPTIGNGSCDPGNACMWQHDNKGGSLLDARGCEPDWYCGLRDFSEWWYFNSNVSPDNRTSSILHRSGNYPWLVVTRYRQGGGTRACFQQGDYIPQTQLASKGLNDNISSMYTSTVNDCNL